MLIKNCTLVFQLTPPNQPFTAAQFLRIAQRGVNTEYRPTRFHAIIMRVRLQEQKTIAALIFRSGRVVLTGVPNPDATKGISRCVCRRVRHSLSGGGDMPPIAVINLRLVNLVGVHTLGHRVAVERMCHDARLDEPVYDPSIFPALRFKIGPTATCLVYISGKVIVTGVRTTVNLNATFELLLSILKDYPRQ